MTHDQGSQTVDESDEPADIFAVEHQSKKPKKGKPLGDSFSLEKPFQHRESAEEYAAELAKRPVINRRNKHDSATPPARPGWTQMWKSVCTRSGDPLPGKLAEILNNAEGWQPRSTTTIPQGFFIQLKEMGGIPGGVIYLDGMILCEIPTMQLQRIKAAREGNVVEAFDSDETDILRTGDEAGIEVVYKTTSKVSKGKGFAD